MHTLFNKLAFILILPLLAMMSLGGHAVPETPSAPLVGAAVQPIAGQTYTLAGSGISASASSFALTSFTITQTGQPIQDSDMSSIFYVTFEPGNRTRQEIVSCTTVGTNTGSTVTISGCARGLSPLSPYSASTTLQFTHGGGTAVLVDPNSPQLFNQFVAKDNSATLTGILTFTSTAQPVYDTQPTFTNPLALVNYQTLLNTAISGAGTSSEATMGIGRIATVFQAASSTASSTSGAPLFLSSRYATDTPQNCSTASRGGCIVMSGLTGKIAQAWLDLTQTFAWTGAHMFASTVGITGTTTVATTTQAGNAFGGNITNNFTAGETINGLATPKPVMVATSTGNVFIVDGDVASTSNFIGFAVNNSVINTTAYVQTDGVVKGFAGLTPGARYYVSDTAGTLSTTPGTAEDYVGFALSATQIYIDHGATAGWQYLGSQGIGTSVDTAINQPFARFAILNVSISGTSCGSNVTLTIAKIGNTSATYTEEPTVTGSNNCSASYTWTASSSIRNTVSAGGAPAQTATAYYYR